MGGSNLSDVKTTPNFALFDPVKIRGGVGEIAGPIVKASPRTKVSELPEYI